MTEQSRKRRKFLRELRSDCAIRRLWISAGRWDKHPTAIAEWRREISATEDYIRLLEQGESLELGS